MQVIANVAAMGKAISSAGKAADKSAHARGSHKPSSYLCLSASADGSYLLAAQQDGSVALGKRLLGCKVVSPGRCLLPIDLVARIVRSVTGRAADRRRRGEPSPNVAEELSIQAAPTEPNNPECPDRFAVIGYERAEWQLNIAADVAEFPDVPGLASGPGMPPARVVDAADLLMAVERTAFATDPSCERFALGAVCFEAGAESLTLVATDGRRLARQAIPAGWDGPVPSPGGFSGSTTLVGLAGIAALAPMLKDAIKAAGTTGTGRGRRQNPAPIRCRLDAAGATFEADGDILAVKATEGRFPRYQDAFPAERRVRLTVESADLERAVKAVTIGTDDAHRGITLEIVAGVARFSGRNAEGARTVSEIAASRELAPAFVSLDPRYLLEMLRRLDKGATGRWVDLDLVDHKSAVVFHAVGTRYDCVVMPLGIEEPEAEAIAKRLGIAPAGRQEAAAIDPAGVPESPEGEPYDTAEDIALDRCEACGAVTIDGECLCPDPDGPGGLPADDAAELVGAGVMAPGVYGPYLPPVCGGDGSGGPDAWTFAATTDAGGPWTAPGVFGTEAGPGGEDATQGTGEGLPAPLDRIGPGVVFVWGGIRFKAAGYAEPHPGVGALFCIVASKPADLDTLDAGGDAWGEPTALHFDAPGVAIEADLPTNWRDIVKIGKSTYVATPNGPGAIRLEKTSGRAGEVYDVEYGPDGVACGCMDYQVRRAGLDAAGCKHVRKLRESGHIPAGIPFASPMPAGKDGPAPATELSGTDTPTDPEPDGQSLHPNATRATEIVHAKPIDRPATLLEGYHSPDHRPELLRSGLRLRGELATLVVPDPEQGGRPGLGSGMDERGGLVRDMEMARGEWPGRPEAPQPIACASCGIIGAACRYCREDDEVDRRILDGGAEAFRGGPDGGMLCADDPSADNQFLPSWACPPDRGDELMELPEMIPGHDPDRGFSEELAEALAADWPAGDWPRWGDPRPEQAGAGGTLAVELPAVCGASGEPAGDGACPECGGDGCPHCDPGFIDPDESWWYVFDLGSTVAADAYFGAYRATEPRMAIDDATAEGATLEPGRLVALADHRINQGTIGRRLPWTLEAIRKAIRPTFGPDEPPTGGDGPEGGAIERNGFGFPLPPVSGGAPQGGAGFFEAEGGEGRDTPLEGSSAPLPGDRHDSPWIEWVLPADPGSDDWAPEPGPVWLLWDRTKPTAAQGWVDYSVARTWQEAVDSYHWLRDWQRGQLWAVRSDELLAKAHCFPWPIEEVLAVVRGRLAPERTDPEPDPTPDGTGWEPEEAAHGADAGQAGPTGDRGRPYDGLDDWNARMTEAEERRREGGFSGADPGPFAWDGFPRRATLAEVKAMAFGDPTPPGFFRETMR